VVNIHITGCSPGGSVIWTDPLDNGVSVTSQFGMYKEYDFSKICKTRLFWAVLGVHKMRREYFRNR
jgi:hypothetical protein